MSLEMFIARRMLREKDKFARSVVNIAIASISVGLTIMILSLGIVRGFKNEITEKISGFGAHIQVVKMDQNSGFESNPVSRDQPFYEEVKTVEGVSHVQVYATKNLILRHNGEIQGVVCKGVGSDFAWEFFSKNLLEGKVLEPEKPGTEPEILVSRIIANKLSLKVGDTLTGIYLSKIPGSAADSVLKASSTPRGINLVVKGIYETGMEEFDAQLVITDIRMVQKLYGWNASQVTGFEILADDFRNLTPVLDRVFEITPQELYPFSIKQIYPTLFSWLPTVDLNGAIVIILMIVVGIMAMVSTLLILILDKTQMIGILKSLGISNRRLGRVFLYHAFYIMLRGIIIGNVFGIGLSLLQSQFHIVKMDQANYYLPYVPVELYIPHLLLLNAGTLLVCMAALLIPSTLAARINPLQAIRFE